MTKDEMQIIEATISYYDHIDMTILIKTHPEFVEDDFKKILAILSKEV